MLGTRFIWMAPYQYGIMMKNNNNRRECVIKASEWGDFSRSAFLATHKKKRERKKIGASGISARNKRANGPWCVAVQIEAMRTTTQRQQAFTFAYLTYRAMVRLPLAAKKKRRGTLWKIDGSQMIVVLSLLSNVSGCGSPFLKGLHIFILW